MAAKEIKQKIVLEGEKQYNQAIRDAQRNLKTLRSELKAETAEMGRNATEQQKAEAKARSLKAQIAEQEKLVKTLREALAQAKAEYGDNADVVQKWEQKLNAARTTLADMKNDLEGVGDGMKTIGADAAKATVATKSVADSLQSLGSVGGSVSGAIEDIFTTLIGRIQDAAVEMWAVISETAAKANNWTDIAGYWGTDAQTIQQYAQAVAATGKNFDDLQNAVTKLVLGGKGKKITELIGISDVNYKNDWDYAMAVLDEMYTMRERGRDLTPIYEEIFGEKRSQKVMDLVNEWRGIQELLPTFNGNETGYGMSDEELGTMNDLWVKINTIEEKWNAIKRNIAAGFGKVSLDLLVNVEGTLDGIADYLNAKDDEGKQAALDKIRANLEEFFRKLGEVIRECIGILREVGSDLKESDDPVVSAIGDILTKMAGALQWMVDHQNEVKIALEAIFGAWLVGKLAAVAGQLSSILLQIKTIQAFKGINMAQNAAGGAASAAGGGFLAGLAKSVPWVAGAAVLFENAVTPQGNDDLFNPDGTPTELGRSLGYTENQEYYDQGGEAHMRREAPREPTEWVEENVDLPERVYTDAQREEALQDWWDARRNAETGADSWDEEASAFEWFQETFGDRFGEVWDRLLQKLDEMEDETQLQDIPEDWWRTTGSWSGASDDNGVTSEDLASFRGLPSSLQQAAKKGVADGVKGLRVEIDGRTAGRILAPYVSEEIAASIR